MTNKELIYSIDIFSDILKDIIKHPTTTLPFYHEIKIVQFGLILLKAAIKRL